MLARKGRGDPRSLKGPGLAHLLNCYQAVPLTLIRAMHSPPLPTGAHRWQPIPSSPWRDPDGSNYALEGQPAQESHPNACSVLMRWVCACELTKAQRIPASNIQTLGETSTGSKFPGQKLHLLPNHSPHAPYSQGRFSPPQTLVTWKDIFYFS